MSLSKKQQVFTQCIGLLINYATVRGYGLTFSDAYRDPRLHGDFGTKKSYAAAYSVHKKRLAVDFNLFVDGKYISDGSHPVWEELGLYWEFLHPEARWGGNFKSKDSVHFSFSYQGYK